jgi:hypothetical protein
MATETTLDQTFVPLLLKICSQGLWLYLWNGANHNPRSLKAVLFFELLPFLQFQAGFMA